MQLNEFETQKNGLTKAEQQKVDEWVTDNPDSPLINWAEKTVNWFKKLHRAANLESPVDEN